MQTNWADLILFSPYLPPTEQRFLEMSWERQLEMKGIWNWVIKDALNRQGVSEWKCFKQCCVELCYPGKAEARNEELVIGALKRWGLLAEDGKVDVKWLVNQPKRGLRIYLWE